MLVIALMATLTVPQLVGRELSGSAVAEVIAPPPAVGTCVRAIADTSPDRLPPANAGAAEALPDRVLPVAAVVPCAGAVIGEVISVSPRSTRRISTLQEYEDANPSCRSRVEPYLGTPATTDLQGVEWTRSIYVDAITVGPDAHDRAGGRTWTACVLSAVGQSYTAPPLLKSSWTSHQLPDAFGLCWADLILRHGVPTPCTTAHTTQQLAFGFVSGPSDSSTTIVSAADTAAVAASCVRLAASIMNVADPTFGGAVAVRVTSDPAGAPYIQCAASATGGRSLVGSLIGLGGRPLPLA